MMVIENSHRIRNDKVRLIQLSALLALAASALGLSIPGIYNETDWAIPQMQGQDVVTALCAGVLLWMSRIGSMRAQLVSIGLLGYIWYTYVGAAFVYTLNELLLVYIASMTVTSAAIIAVARDFDQERLRLAFDKAGDRAPRVALLILGGMLSLLWLTQIITFVITGTQPEGVRLGGNGFIYPYVLDLGVVVPLCALGARLIRRRESWGYVIATSMMIKAATMGLALIAMSAASIAAGFEAPVELFATWILIAAGGLAMSFWMLDHCKERSHEHPVPHLSSKIASLD